MLYILPMKNRGAEKDVHLVLPGNLKKRLSRVARELRLSLPEAVHLAIATQLPRLQRLGLSLTQDMQDRCPGPESQEPPPSGRGR